MRWRRRRFEHQLDAELQFHLEQQIRDYMASGMTEVEARRKARLAFGGVDHIKEECREVRAFSVLETMVQDVAYAFRIMRKSWGFSTVVVLSLALGIGANTAVFTLIDAVMWRMLPVKDPETLLSVGRTEDGNFQSGFTYEQYRAMREHSQVGDLAGYATQRMSVTIDGNLEPAAGGQLVSGNYFSLLGVTAIAGRTITIDDDQVPDGHPVAMISHRYWTSRFGRDPATLGRTISLSGTPFTIIGITPSEFFGVEVGASPDIFVPMMMQPAVMPVVENLLEKPQLYWTWIEVVARLKEGIRANQAEAALQPLFAQHVPPPKFGGARPRLTIVLSPAATGISELRNRFSQPLLVLMSLVGMVLLIACANIANLFLARAAARHGEFALRLAIGAGRWRLIRQLLVESVVLASLGGAGAIVLAGWGTRFLLEYVSSGRNPVVLDVSFNLRVFAFTAAASIGTGILFGLASAMRAGRLDLAPALKHMASSSRRHGVAGPRRILAVMQVSLSLVLLIGAGLFVRSLRNLNGQDSGFPRDRVLLARIEPRGSDQRYSDGTLQRLDRIYSELLERVKTIPGVRSATLANVSPTKPESGCCGVRDPQTRQVTYVPSVMVYPGYFETLEIPLVAGRGFDSADFRENSPEVCLINETFARTRFHGEDPVGKLVNRAVIIGVVKDSRYTSLREATPPTFYMPFFAAGTGRGQMILHVRTSIDPDLIRSRMREEVWKADPSVPQFDVYTLAEEVDAVLVQERLVATLASLLGGMALLLAAIGLYALLAFGVVQRQGEMGIRMALGAMRRDVVWMVLTEALILVLSGIAIGVPAALALARFASSQITGLLFGLTVTDPLTITASTALLILVATIAAYLPARRASRVDPIRALRYD